MARVILYCRDVGIFGGINNVIVWITWINIKRCELYRHVVSNINRVATVREKSGKTKIFQGQGKVREFCKRSGKILEVCESQ